ncbi:MAG: V-type ATPase subunit, partial [bacterium]
LPLPFKEAVEKILTADTENEKRGDEIDFIIDRALYLYLSQETKRSGNEFLIHLIIMMIDMINLRSFSRINGFKGADNLFERSFIPGGNIDEKKFYLYEEGQLEEIMQKIIENSSYSELKPLFASGDSAMIETGMDNLIISYLRQTRQRAFGVEPLIGYMLAKEFEIKNLRILYVGKSNTLEETLIKERLRETYV